MSEEESLGMLITAFAYSYALMNEAFYLRKKDHKVIVVHFMDYALVSECKSEYESGLAKEEEREIQEAIIASEKNYDTHIQIPRLAKAERFKLMQEFVDQTNSYKMEMEENLHRFTSSLTSQNMEQYSTIASNGLEMEYLTHGIQDQALKSDWTQSYRDHIKTIALKWLNKQTMS